MHETSISEFAGHHIPSEIKHGTFPGDPSETVATETTTWGKVKALYGTR